MENAVFIRNDSELKDPSGLTGRIGGIPPAWRASALGLPFSRIYFGGEFCERLLPERDAMEMILQKAVGMKLDVTFVTPFVTEKWLESWTEAAGIFLSAFPGGEIVFNDLGLFHLLKKSGKGFAPVLGRLLTKQKRGPRIQRLKGKVPNEMMEHFQSFGADSPLQAEFFRELGFVRYELDNTLQGIRRDSDFPASLHYPYFFITTTRMCLPARCLKDEISGRVIGDCRRECAEIAFRITHESMGIPVIIAGNSQFGENRTLAEDPESLGIDRIVHSGEVGK